MSMGQGSCELGAHGREWSAGARRRTLIRAMVSSHSMSISISLPVSVFTLICCGGNSGGARWARGVRGCVGRGGAAGARSWRLLLEDAEDLRGGACEGVRSQASYRR